MLEKHSVSIRGHRTSYSLEPEFQRELEAIAQETGTSLAALIARIDAGRKPETNLSSALRLHVLAHLKSRVDRAEG